MQKYNTLHHSKSQEKVREIVETVYKTASTLSFHSFVLGQSKHSKLKSAQFLKKNKVEGPTQFKGRDLP